MNQFLAVDTSSRYLTVIVYSDKPYITYREDCAMRHSELLMDAVEETFQKAGIGARDCDFFACCTGPGSFTGIRIGIACIKGFALAFSKPMLGVTSFACAAYDVEGDALVCIDAGHGHYYACAFDKDKNVVMPPAYLAERDVLSRGEPKVSFEDLAFPTAKADMSKGFLNAVLHKKGEAGEDLAALYVRRSQAEENRR